MRHNTILQLPHFVLLVSVFMVSTGILFDLHAGIKANKSLNNSPNRVTLQAPLAFSQALLTPPSLQLKTGWWSGVKYIYNDQQAKSAFGFFSISKNFEQILQKHPNALNEAKKANAYRALQAGGSLLMLAGATLLLVHSLNSDLESGGSSYGIDLGLVITGAIVNVFSGSQVKNLSRKAVAIYNDQEAKLSGNR